MKLQTLKIGDYRVLKNLVISFSGDLPSNLQNQYRLDFFAGVNGTGKSTVLLLLARLFQALNQKKVSFPVAIKLTYTINKNNDPNQSTEVIISNVIENEEQGENRESDKTFELVPNGLLTFTVNGVQREKGTVLGEEYLPEQVVIYTSGNENTWLQDLDLFPTEEETDSSENLNTNDTRTLFLKSSRMEAVTLAGLLANVWPNSQTEKKLKSVLTELNITKCLGFSLRCRVHESLIAPDKKDFIDQLTKVADTVVSEDADRLLVFNLAAQITKHQNAKDNIFGLRNDPLDLFREIYRLYDHKIYEDAPLQELNIFLQRTFSVKEDEEKNKIELWNWLSDGERSFLSRMGLFALFNKDNILILLDEPEVHFNDVWKREIVNILNEIMQGKSTHAVISTHSSIALTDVPKENILRFSKVQNSGRTSTVGTPSINTLGADPSDIIVHVFGAANPSGQRSVSYIKHTLATADRKEDLSRLEEIIAPGYWSYRLQLEKLQLKD